MKNTFPYTIRRSVPASVFLVMLYCLPSAQAATIIQDSGVYDLAIGAYDPIGQSFVAEDPLLDAIAFAFSDMNPTWPNDPITMTLYEGAGFSGTMVTTVTQTLPDILPSTSASPEFIDFDFSGTSLVVGNTYTAAITTASYKVGVVYTNLDVYANGQLFESDPWSDKSGDLNFRITPAVVPVPAAVWLFGSGLIGIIGVARQKKLA